MQSIFNSRELAVLSWLAIFVIYILYRKDLRPSALSLIRRLFVLPIVSILAIAFTYISSIIFVLFIYGLWDMGLLKATVIWCATVATIHLFRVITKPENADFFSDALKDLVKITVVLEFAISFYSLSYWVEFLVILPAITLVTMVNAYSENHEEYEPAHRLTSGILSLFGLTMLTFAIWRIVGDFGAFTTVGVMKDFALPIVLGLFFLPFVYAAWLWSIYERVFLP